MRGYSDTTAVPPDSLAGSVPSLGGGDSYTLGPSDVIQVSVYGVPELGVTGPISADGYIQLPLLGPTRAAGKTAEQLQKEITERFAADYLQNPQVMVLVQEYNSRFVVVTGAMRNGVYPLKSETTLLQLVAAAGGFGEMSDSTVVIIRQSGGKRTAAKFDVRKIEKGQAPDVKLRAGDRILAGESQVKKFYGLSMKALGIAGRFAIF
jgi:polysaccharide export outer membrane protein